MQRSFIKNGRWWGDLPFHFYYRKVIMTAEIAILNSYGVALAADSAVTIDLGNGEKKIYNTANKLFMLSKYQPVGIMIYNNSKLLGIDWELIIKLFRKELGKKKYPKLVDYSNAFLDFIKTNSQLFTEQQQQNYFINIAIIHYRSIKESIIKKTTDIIKSDNKIEESRIIQIIDDVIDETLNKWKEKEKNKYIVLEYGSLINKYKDILQQIRTTEFENLPISDSNIEKIHEIIFLSITSIELLKSYSGIIIAGYGEDEIFPTVNSFLIEGMLENQLKYNSSKNLSISLDNAASIIPFAQSEMVGSFMEGVDPQYESFIEKQLNTTIESIKEILQDNDKMKADNIKKLFLKTLFDFRRNGFINPVINIVASLPKDDLAAMAESLVNLTSFKRKVSSEAETVGGPIDVAVISKGDGFIWIKRKHYFKPELNNHFFSNYYREDIDGE